ncbi:hypothetical protein BJX70DRAFT_12687 [Aspergillus crustosus]
MCIESEVVHHHASLPLCRPSLYIHTHDFLLCRAMASVANQVQSHCTPSIPSASLDRPSHPYSTINPNSPFQGSPIHTCQAKSFDTTLTSN